MMAIEGSEYFCTIHVLTPPTPKKEKRYLVTGDMCVEGISQDVKVNETLNSMADAVERKQMLEEVGGKNFSIKEIEIELQEAE